MKKVLILFVLGLFACDYFFTTSNKLESMIFWVVVVLIQILIEVVKINHKIKE
jgi:membrane protein DedA with SNARE-associated domain